MAIKYLQTKSTTTTYGISSSSTTIQLKNLLKLDGTSVSASDIGDLLYGTFSPGTSREEIFSIVGANVTIESNGNVSITSVTRGLKEVSPYTTGGYSCDHPAGEVVVFGNNPQVYQYLKDYIDNIAISGGVDASTTAKGISKLSVAPVSATDPIAVGTNDPRIPTTDYTNAMAGTQGVPSATNKYVTSDNVYDSETDQVQATQNGSVQFGEANSTGNKYNIAQSFIPVKTKIRGVKLYKIANTGTFTGDVSVLLNIDNSGSPSGTTLASVTITNSVYNALPVGEFEAIFSAEYSMTAGTRYWIVIASTTGDNSNHPNLGTNTAGGYANGSVKYYNGTDGNVAIATIDLYFKTLEGIKNQLLMTNNSGGIDTSILKLSTFPIPAFQQQIPTGLSTQSIGSISTGQGSCSNSDGSVLYIIAYNNITAGLMRYKRDAITGQYYVTHYADSPNASYSLAMAVVGNYLYVMSATGVATQSCTRYLASDLSGPQVMTAPNVAAGQNNLVGWSDGTYMYIIGCNAPTSCFKISISGTVMSSVDTVTSVTPFESSQFVSAIYDGTNVFVSDYYAGGGYWTVKKMSNIRCTALVSTLTVGNIYTDDYLSGVSGVSIIANIDYQRMYIGTLCSVYNSSAMIKSPAHIFPVSKS